MLGSIIPDSAHQPYVHPNNKKSDDHVDPELYSNLAGSKIWKSYNVPDKCYAWTPGLIGDQSISY